MKTEYPGLSKKAKKVLRVLDLAYHYGPRHEWQRENGGVSLSYLFWMPAVNRDLMADDVVAELLEYHFLRQGDGELFFSPDGMLPDRSATYEPFETDGFANYKFPSPEEWAEHEREWAEYSALRTWARQQARERYERGHAAWLAEQEDY